MKNLLLSIFAVILTICLIGLIFLATNQNALAKVHQTICTFSKANKVSALEKTIKFTDFKTANASEKNEDNHNDNQQKTTYLKKDNHRSAENHFTPRECKVIALNYASNHLNENYDLKQVNYQNQSSKYQYVNQQNQQQSNIVVNDNGQVGENHSHMR